ncbi:MAG: OmpA family protein [Pseudomonadota bacterium]
MRIWLLILALSLSPAHAIELQPALGTEVARDENPAGSVRLPTEPWQPDVIYPESEGTVVRRVFQVPNPALTTLQLIDPLRTTLIDEGYSEVFSCADRACGGFDFRFELDLVPPPAMFVDLGNYRYLLMENQDAEAKLVSIVASASSSTAYLHFTEVYEAGAPPIETKVGRATNEVLPSSDLISSLVQTGHVILEDLEFDVGSAELGAGPFPSLRSLADWLSEMPSARVVLVGHTDSIGSLEANLALSQRRASSVLTRLINGLGVSPTQIFSDGAGALSPIASNLTEEGRALNRRVEVVLLSIE